MNIVDAAHKTVHDYPGGSEALGARIGMSAAVLRNKVNPNNTTHHLTLAEADEIMSITGNLLMLRVLAENQGCIVQQGSAGDADAMSTLTLALDEQVSQGAFAKTVRDALADNLISENEMKAIAASGFEAQHAISALLHRLRSLSDKAFLERIGQPRPTT